MKVIKKINNNFAIAIDGNQEELIIYGRGVGFPVMPYDLDDLSVIDRSYYNVDPKYIELFNAVSDEIILIASEIVDTCRNRLDSLLNPNIVFTLSDHIAYCVKRLNKHIHIEMPLIYDLQQSYPKEIKIAKDAIKLINQRLQIKLPDSEAAGIAINIINNEMSPQKWQMNLNTHEMIEHITKIVEQSFHLNIECDSINFTRFATHIQYLFQRLVRNEPLKTENIQLLDILKKECPIEYSTALKIIDYLEREFNKNIQKEEILYLMLHINRVCTYEDFSNSE